MRGSAHETRSSDEVHDVGITSASDLEERDARNWNFIFFSPSFEAPAAGNVSSLE